MDIGKIKATIKSNLDEYAELIKEAVEAIQKVNDFEVKVDVIQEKD